MHSFILGFQPHDRQPGMNCCPGQQFGFGKLGIAGNRHEYLPGPFQSNCR